MQVFQEIENKRIELYQLCSPIRLKQACEEIMQEYEFSHVTISRFYWDFSTVTLNTEQNVSEFLIKNRRKFKIQAEKSLLDYYIFAEESDKNKPVYQVVYNPIADKFNHHFVMHCQVVGYGYTTSFDFYMNQPNCSIRANIVENLDRFNQLLNYLLNDIKPIFSLLHDQRYLIQAHELPKEWILFFKTLLNEYLDNTDMDVDVRELLMKLDIIKHKDKINFEIKDSDFNFSITELKMFALILKNETFEQVAQKLKCSKFTVRNKFNLIREMMHLNDKNQLIDILNEQNDIKDATDLMIYEIKMLSKIKKLISYYKTKSKAEINDIFKRIS